MSVLLEARSFRPFKSSEAYLIAMKEDLAEWLNALYPELRMSLDNFMDKLDTGVTLCKNNPSIMSVLLEARSFRPFKSSEEYLIAMKEDLAEWLNALYPELRISLDNFMDRLDTGVALCKHANSVRKSAFDYVVRRQARKIMTRSITSSLAMPMSQLSDVAFLPNAKAGTFFARDNVSNFITWCRNSLGIIECLLFETDDLIMRKNERHVILCLLEVARRGAKFGMLAPMLVQMERQIDREIAADNKANNAGNNLGTSGNGGHNNHDDDEDADDEDEYADINQEEPCLIYGPQPQIVTNDLKSLDEMVRDLVERCTCPTQFPMIRVSEGKYRIGDTKVLIFVRILRSHVMVRVGGGWDTLSHYLDKHDPCRCRTSHRSMISAKLIQKAGGSFDLGSAQVHYERSPPRTRRSSASSVGSCAGTAQQPTQQQQQQQQQQSPSHQLQTPRSASAMGNRSRSPTPHQIHRQLGNELKKTGNRSPSPTPQAKLPSSPVRRQMSDLGNAQRSRSPTPKMDVQASTASKSGNLDPTRKALNDEIRQVRYDGRSHMYHSRHLEDYEDPKIDLHREIREKVPLSEEFTKRYVVEGGVARRTTDRDDAPKYEPAIYGYKCGGERESSSNSSPIPSPETIKEEEQQEQQQQSHRPMIANTGNEDLFSKESSQQYVKSLHTEGEHSDNGSEVSDEGYRSLGAVQTAIATTISQNHQDTSIASLDSQKETDKPKNELSEDVRSCVETESIETGLRKTRTTGGVGVGVVGVNGGGAVSSPTKSLSPISSSIVPRNIANTASRSPSTGSCSINGQNGERPCRGSSMARENSNLSRCSSSGSRTPRDGNSSPEGSPLKRATSGRNSLRKPPAPPASSLGRSHGGISRNPQTVCDISQSRNNETRLSSGNGTCNNVNGQNSASNTWNGRQTRQRPSLTTETFVKPTSSVRSTSNVKSASPTNFSRKNPSRQSLPRLGTCATSGNNITTAIGSPQYDRNGRRIKSSTTTTSTSLQTSPTKIANPLLEQILAKMSHLRDDREVVEKLQGLIRDYQGHVVTGDESDNDTTRHDGNDPNLEFTRAWIDGNGTVALPQSDVQLVASPRKDPKPPSERGSGYSRIPAPVVYKRPMSVASDSL